MTLRDAHAAIQRGDDREALVALLAAWRACPDRDLAHAIELVGQRAAKTVPRPNTWPAAAATDPVVLHHVLAMFDECARPDRLARLQAIAAIDDPRVCAKVVAVMCAGLSCRRYQEFRAALAMLGRQRDSRVVDSIPALLARYERPGWKRAMASTCKRIRSVHRDPPKLAAQDLAIVAEIVAALTPVAGGDAATSSTEAALLEAVYAAPLDDGPREIYADWLLERDDPRGEFIMLQLEQHRTDELTEKQRERVAALREAYGVRWAGGRNGASFSRGFVGQLEGLTSDAPDDPIYATIEDSDRVPPRRAWAALKDIWGASTKDLLLLPEFPPTSPLEALCWKLGEDDDPRALDAKAIAAYRRATLPALKYFSISDNTPRFTVEDPRFRPERITWMLDGKPKLTELQFPGHPKHLAAYLAWLEPTAVRSLHVHMLSPSLDIVRDGPGPFTRLELEITPPSDEAVIELVCEAIEALPPSLSKVSIVSSYGGIAKLLARTKKRLRRAVAKHPSCVVEPQ